MSKDLAQAAEALAAAAGEMRAYLADRQRADRAAEDRALGPELPPLRRPGLYDRLGRRQPRRLTIPTILLAIPGAPERCRRVPARAVVEEREDEALVACPCGAQPVAPADQLAKCPGCDRHYGYLGGLVLVLYGDMEIPTR